jgi:hypothetical protein
MWMKCLEMLNDVRDSYVLLSCTSCFDLLETWNFVKSVTDHVQIMGDLVIRLGRTLKENRS